MPRSALAGVAGALITAAVLGSAASAGAAQFCVNHAGCSAPADNFSDIQSAIDHAGIDSTPDTILVGAGTYDGPFTDNSGNPVTLIGAGSATLLDRPGTGDSRTTLSITEPASKFSSLRVAVPAGNAGTGISSSSTLDRVVVTDAATSPFSSGIVSGGTLDHATVTMTSAWTIGVYGNRVRRSRISATGMGVAVGGLLENSLVRLTASGAGRIGVDMRPPSPGTTDLRQVTVVGPADADSYGVHASSFGPAGGAVSLNGAVIRGFGHALVAQAGSYYCGEDINMLPMYCPSPTTINVSYSDFDPGHDIADGTYGQINSGAGNVNVDPAFRNAGAGDYSLRRISPVIDRGDPHAPFAGDSTTDLAGGPRKADGDGNGRAIIDMGAFELPPPRFGLRTLVNLDRGAKKIPGSGPLPVVVSNLNGFLVTGTVSGKTASKIPVGHQKKRRVPLESKTFSVAGHRKVTVSLDLPKKVVKYFEDKGKLTVDLLARVRDPAGHVRTIAKTISVKLK